MNEIIIQNVLEILTALALMLISVVGAWVSLKLGKKQELAAIAAATNEATAAAQRTVLALQQTTVEAMKAASEDGKLTDSEIETLGALLLEKALAQMSEPALKVLSAAGKDISAIIRDAGEAMILAMKK